MRIRTIKPEFWTNETLALGCSDTDRLLALGLLNYADDEGYFLANPALVRSALRPFDDDSTIVRASLKTLQKIGWIEVFDDADGRKVGCVVNFSKHQRIDRPKPSEFSNLRRFDEQSTNDRRTIEDESLLEQGTGNREQGKEIEAFHASPRTDAKASWSEATGFQIPDSVLSEFAEAYPACDIKAQALRAHIWLKSNPKRKKKDYHRFLTGWLSRAQESGGDDRTAARRAGGGRGARVEVVTGLEQDRAIEAKRAEDGPQGWREMLESHYAEDPDILAEIAGALTWDQLIWNLKNQAWSLHDEARRKG